MGLLAKIATPLRLTVSLARRLYAWHVDLVSASYYAAEFPYSQFEGSDSDEVLYLVTKTRGGQQYYQREESMAWDISHDELLKHREIVMCNSEHMYSLVEAEGRNRSLSVQRKAYAGLAVFVIGVVLEIGFGIDISILT